VQEKELQRARELDRARADPEMSGAEAATVYRDKRGRKLDMLNEFMRQQAVKEGKVSVVFVKTQIDWNKDLN